MNKTTEKTLCEGTITFIAKVDGLANRVISAQFSKTIPSQKCETCEWNPICLRLRNAPQQDTVTVKAFSGMIIGEFPIIKKTSKFIETQTKTNQILKFDIKTGEQINAKDPRYANKIDAVE